MSDRMVAEIRIGCKVKRPQLPQLCEAILAEERPELNGLPGEAPS